MTLVVSDIINSARDEHPSFDERRHPDRVLVRMLSRYQRELVAKALHRNAAVLLQRTSVTLPLANFDAGITLPANKFVSGADAILATDTTVRTPIELLDWGRHSDPAPFPSGWIENGVLYLQGQARDWERYGSIVVFYIPEPAELTSPNSTFVLPDSAAPALVANTAAFMVRRGHNDPALPPVDAQFFYLRAAAIEESWLQEISRQRHLQILEVRDVW